MSEPPPQQTADNAVRAFILLFALGFVLRGIDVMDRDISDAIKKWLMAAGVTILDYFYVPIRTVLGHRFAATAGKVGTDFRWWVATIFLILSWSVISPFIEHQRWPFAAIQAPSAEDIAPIRDQLNTVTQQRDAALANTETLNRQLEEARKEAPIQPLSATIHNARISLDKLTTIMRRFQERRLLFVEGCDQYQKILNDLNYRPHPSGAFFAQKVEHASKEIAEDYSNYYSKSADMPAQSDNFPQGVPLQDEDQKLPPQQQYQLRKWGYWCARTISRIGGIGEEYGSEKNHLEQAILQK